MAWPMIAAAAAQGAGAVASSFLGFRSAGASYRQAKESIRRQDVANAQTVGSATAAAYASGLALAPIGYRSSLGLVGRDYGGSASMTLALGDISAEFQREHDWASSQARSARDLAKVSAGLGFLTGAGSALFSYGQATNWGKAASTDAIASAAKPTYVPGQGMPLWRP